MLSVSWTVYLFPANAGYRLSMLLCSAKKSAPEGVDASLLCITVKNYPSVNSVSLREEIFQIFKSGLVRVIYSG